MTSFDVFLLLKKIKERYTAFGSETKMSILGIKQKTDFQAYLTDVSESERARRRPVKE